MGHRRRHPRISNTEDLSATLRCPGSISVAGRVLNLSEGGMLVAGSGLRRDSAENWDRALPAGAIRAYWAALQR